MLILAVREISAARIEGSSFVWSRLNIRWCHSFVAGTASAVIAAHDEIHVHECFSSSSPYEGLRRVVWLRFYESSTPVKVVAYGFLIDELSAALEALSLVKINTFQGFTR